ncbi:hypothetical protein A2U01_0059417 [Trifolium medium]|uniref:Uncharacterized protein n=1 Tax=Trifolium medium TaxID=97028 RepID=A0A392RPE5_9FABA|nr:hypothetical protein [Trifolium medium]
MFWDLRVAQGYLVRCAVHSAAAGFLSAEWYGALREQNHDATYVLLEPARRAGQVARCAFES